jgi:hypothetical protein
MPVIERSPAITPSTSCTSGDGIAGNARAISGAAQSSAKAAEAIAVRDAERLVNRGFMVCPFRRIDANCGALADGKHLDLRDLPGLERKLR